ncbi:hypothetical protein MTBLM1_70211 [Rhodospirillaceae bacterium LM-1]|nr:hypothetical protein MTBLM1_70211 [Rhodospirillaceae bacterium LM-1]
MNQMAWQPIENAPKDDASGSYILVWGEKMAQPDMAYWREGRWWSATEHDGFAHSAIDPSHWMPLPPIPSTRP